MLLVHLAHRRHADHLLHIIDKRLVAAEEQPERVLPYLTPLIPRRTSGNLGDQVFRVMRLLPSHSSSEVIGGTRRVEQALIPVKVVHVGKQHRPCGIERGRKVFIIPALLREGQVIPRADIRKVQPQQATRHGFFQRLTPCGKRVLRNPGIFQCLFRFLHLVLRIRKLEV